MAVNVAAGRGALYRLNIDLSVTKVLAAVTISNGLDWSSNGRGEVRRYAPDGTLDTVVGLPVACPISTSRQ